MSLEQSETKKRSKTSHILNVYKSLFNKEKELTVSGSLFMQIEMNRIYLKTIVKTTIQKKYDKFSPFYFFFIFLKLRKMQKASIILTRLNTFN